ncbi:MAG: alanine--tRNA ligase [Candidatus Woesearchaeota archaeon]|jgi:alanyl-tRNA synthetase|nr:alanine--tRNA ligase [Candidatus Woesearchaeota archaeon]MDP7181612.1 alanine--tRNA ligase [Candidatus Woesearchaeota archaeon]MDP7198920.1 alanine--tRNA ligase [Candidatus Woesearchaeota archaeon]MDP7467299.1 alanine--tRNA ligase [Candidatus Woesearchaeota archaeon]MDP7647915.1 alanine--tRNA ligase [Candidatus Woesearchaeota archaeon]
MDAKTLIKKYLDFFASKQHAVIPSASLIPENDPTVLFTTAGMHPLVPFLLGQPHPQGKRICDVQKCIRTTDIEEVGDDTHLTFFEMLGNWSLGDYFKKETIAWSWEFLTSKEWLGIPKERLSITCFAGDADAPKDEESAEVWRSLGVPEERIAFLPKEDNWWGPAGKTGPCGPDTEIFYYKKDNPPQKFDPKDDNWVEIWNNVLMQFNKQEDGELKPLSKPSVDTGMGVERTIVALQGKQTVYDTELFQPILATIRELAEKQDHKAERIIADHIRTATFVLGEDAGVVPSNMDQGYILRRLIRRAVRYGRNLGIDQTFCHVVASVIIKEYKARYPELLKNEGRIVEELQREEKRFKETLEQGLKIFDKVATKDITGEQAFLLFQSHGFPLELTMELAKERGFSVDEKGYHEAFKKHQKASKGDKFASGLADHSTQTVSLHTATHLLHAALRKIFGDEVQQKGSNITPERLRFDFSFPRKLTQEEKEQVEKQVNEWIQTNTDVTNEEMSLTDAKKAGAIAFFGEKYDDAKVSVYSIPGISKEVCTGPHVKNTKDIGAFKIKKEESVSAGVRRIKATVN